MANEEKILFDDNAQKRYDELKQKSLILFEVIRGSHSYGTNIESSDIDKAFIYIESLDNILSGNASIQLNLTKDYTGYELGRYIELLGKQNPNIIELLHADERFVEFCHPLFKELLIERRNSFLSNKVAFSFGQYAKTQIDKAQGTNKKFMNPMDGPRKSLLDFAWVAEGQGSISLAEWLSREFIPSNWVGLSSIDHMKYTYNLFVEPLFDDIRRISLKEYNDLFFGRRNFWRKLFKMKFSEEEVEVFLDIFHTKLCQTDGYISKYNGPVDVDGVQPKLSSIPKGEKPAIQVQFNLDGFQKYCTDYREYHEWLEKRNMQRFVENSENEHNYDRKNMMHCHRLLDMCIEILSGQGVNVYRPNREELLGIRHGQSTYQELVDKANEKIAKIDELRKTCTLPESCSKDMMDSIVLEFRYRFYGILRIK